MTEPICIHCRDNGIKVCNRVHCDSVRRGEYTLDQCRECWRRINNKQLQSSAQHLLQRIENSCIYRGDPTGETRSCPACRGHVELKLFSCEVYDTCVLSNPVEGIQCCRDCLKRSPRPVIQVETRSQGIGDTLMTLCIANGLREQHKGTEIVLSAPTWSHQWLKLFDGYDYLTSAPIKVPTCFCDNSVDYPHFSREGKPRWQFWQEKFNTVARIPSMVSSSQESRDWAIPYSSSVVLSPFSAFRERTWPLENWLEVERQLNASGLRVCIIDDLTDRCERFQVEGKILAQSAARVSSLLRDALCFVGNDSGMMHLAGMMGVRSVAITARLSDVNIAGMYSNTRVLGGRDIGLEGVTPQEVVKSIKEQIRGGIDSSFPVEEFLSILPEQDRCREHSWPSIYSVLYTTLRDLNNQRPIRKIVEIGTRIGAGAWTMFQAIEGVSVQAYDIEELESSSVESSSRNLYGGFFGSCSYARNLLADRDYTCTAADSQRLDRIPKCDLCYIDGDHSEEGCFNDLLLAERSGADRILCDDYTTLGVKTAVQRFLKRYPLRQGRFFPSQTGLFLLY